MLLLMQWATASAYCWLLLFAVLLSSFQLQHIGALRLREGQLAQEEFGKLCLEEGAGEPLGWAELHPAEGNAACTEWSPPLLAARPLSREEKYLYRTAQICSALPAALPVQL